MKNQAKYPPYTDVLMKVENTSHRQKAVVKNQSRVKFKGGHLDVEGYKISARPDIEGVGWTFEEAEADCKMKHLANAYVEVRTQKRA